MRFVVVAIALAAGFLGLASSQMAMFMDCASPTSSDIEAVLTNILRGGDSSTTPDINIMNFTPRCLAVSEQRGRFRYFSVLVEYTCDGHSLCPTGMAREQIDSECANGEWGSRVFDSPTGTRDESPEDAPVSVPTRRDCSFCASPTLSLAGVGVQSDNVYHCVECMGCSENPGQNACTGLSSDDCCNVYVYDNTTGKYLCDTGCPDDGIYIIDPDTFNCLITCEDLGNGVENGDVEYSPPIVQPEGRYRVDTTATVTCNAGFRGGGVITCEGSGEWSSPSLPTCEPLPIVDCDDPPLLDNGKLTETPTSTTVGSIVMYECNDGYGFKQDSPTTRTCLETGEWSNEDIECIKNVVCDEGFERDDNNECKRISGGSSTCIPCIVIPLAVVLAALAVAAVIAAFVYYRWKKAPSTKLKEKDAEGINGVARDNPLYLDPATVAEEAGE